eukprot:8819702-Prorocentrum_lima.AAC.1
MCRDHYRGGGLMHPDLDSQLPPERGRVVDHIRRYRGHSGMAPTGFLDGRQMDAGARQLMSKELHPMG